MISTAKTPKAFDLDVLESPNIDSEFLYALPFSIARDASTCSNPNRKSSAISKWNGSPPAFARLALENDAICSTSGPAPSHEWPLVCPRLIGVFVSLWPRTMRAYWRTRRVSLRCAPAIREKSVAVLLAAALAIALPAATAAQEYVPGESRSKAAFVATFPSFIDWPDGTFPSPDSPLTTCVLGDFRFGTTLAEVSRDSTPHGRRIAVRWIRNDQQIRGCHILFVSSSELSRYSKVIAAVQGTSTFTVGETTDFVSAGGMLSIAFEHEAIQFEVNLASAKEAHFRVSSRLLALAHRIVEQTESSRN